MTATETDRVYLRPLEESDVTDRYLAWFRDPEVTRFLEARHLGRQEVLDYIRAGKTSGTYLMYAICDASNDLHIGNLKIGPIVRAHGTSDLVTVIGDRRYWGRGLATEAIAQARRIAFDQLGLRKLSAGMYADNIGSLKCYTRAGWKVEGRLVGQYVNGDRVVDRICIGCFNPEFFEELPDGTVVPRPRAS